jgi:hypothetical protein
MLLTGPTKSMLPSRFVLSSSSRFAALGRPKLELGGSSSVVRSIFSDTKSFAFTHRPSGSINQKLESSIRAGYKCFH